MKSFYLILLKLCVTIKSSPATLSTEDHVNLILDVYDVYKPSSLLFVHFDDYRNWTKMSSIFNIQASLSRKIMSSVINFDDYYLFIKRDFCNAKSIKIDVKPMSVFYLNSERNIKKMKDLENCFPSNLANLVLFMKTEDRLLEFCMRPIGNPFLIRGGLTFLVKCYEDSNIQKWQSLNTNKMRVFKWASWNQKSGLVLKKSDSMFKEINQLNGQVLVVTSVEDLEIFNFYSESIVLALIRAANFTIIKIDAQKSYGNWNENNKTWSGALSLVENGKVDLVASLFLMTSQRSSSFDYTLPVKRYESSLYIRKPSSKSVISWTGYLMPFTYEVWITIALMFISTHALLTFMKTKLQKGFRKRKYVIENYLYVWHCYCQQGLSEFPKSASLRIVYTSIFLFAYVILCVYSASFISDLTVNNENLPFTSLEGFLREKSYKLAVFRDTGTFEYFQKSTESPWKEMAQLLINKNELPPTAKDALNMICQNNVAFWSNDVDISELGNTSRTCPLIKIKTGLYIYTAMVLRKNSPFTKVINYHLKRIKEAGFFNYLDSKFTLQQNPSLTKHNYTNITFWHTSALLAIIAGGVVLSLMILCLEKMDYNSYSKIRMINY